MGAFPTSDMPGYKSLHGRVTIALDFCQERKDIDFKESTVWDTLKFRIVKTALGMANLRDGGIIIIGVSERNQVWDLTGIKPEHVKTYDVDIIIDFINKYASPYIGIDIALVKYSDGKVYLAIYVNEFNDTPIVCKKNGPDSKDIRKGGVYVRPPGIAKTTIVTEAAQMHDLLELAAEKRARRFLETASQVGLAPRKPKREKAATSAKQFKKELMGL